MSLYTVRTPSFIPFIFSGFTWSNDSDDILLTFDDGPYPETTPWILDHLDSVGRKAIFFVQGVNVERYPDLFEEIVRRGHTIGNHGYKHLAGWKLSVADFHDNVIRGAELSGSTLFRPPYGQIGYRQYQAIKERHEVMMWSIMPGDFVEGINLSDRMKRVNNSLTKGDIIVLHDNPEHFDRMKGMLKLISISDCQIKCSKSLTDVKLKNFI